MKLSADQAVRQSPVSSETIPRWANEELLPLLRQLRTAVNACAIERSLATSAGTGAYVRVWTSPAMPTDATWHIEALVAGVDAAAGRAGYALAATFASVASAVAQVGGTTTIASHESDAAIDARLGVDVGARTVYLEARDAGALAMIWSAVTQTHEARL